MASRVTGSADLARLRKVLAPDRFLPLLEANVAKANKAAGLEITGHIQRRIRDQVEISGKGSEGPGDLHPFTVHRRNTRRLDNAARSGDPEARRVQSRRYLRRTAGRRERPYRTRRGAPHKRLIDSGALLRSITSRTRRLQFIVGVLANTRGGVSYAAVQEYGAVINVTPKMRAFLHAKGLHLRPGTTKIEVPGQRYMHKGLRGSGSIARKHWSAAVEATIRGKRL